MTTTRTPDEQAHVAHKLAPDRAQADRRGMTPQQRRELERLIDERVYAAVAEAAKYGASGKHDERMNDHSRNAYRDLMHYLDEVTDWGAA